MLSTGHYRRHCGGVLGGAYRGRSCGQNRPRYFNRFAQCVKVHRRTASGGFSCGGDHLSKGNPPGNEGAESAGAGKACQLPAEQHGRLQIRRIAYAADGYAYRGAVCA